MKNFPLPRLDQEEQLHDYLIKFCRLKRGEIWEDPEGKHRVGCIDATNFSNISALMDGNVASLAIQDPPYNLAVFEQRSIEDFIEWCNKWVTNTNRALDDNASLYVWIGADQKTSFQPLPDFMIMMRHTDFRPRSFITMRNQRGYGTQQNWMSVRQELLFYIKGSPDFNVEAEYTDIPKILKGYYKKVKGEVTENSERSKSENIRAGNVWVDVQQVFYRMDENVNGCYAQKPLKSSERIIRASSKVREIVLDFFCHSGTTLLSCELNNRRCFTADIDPVYCEIAIRRLERFRKCGRLGWQNGNPFEEEIQADVFLRKMLSLPEPQIGLWEFVSE